MSNDMADTLPAVHRSEIGQIALTVRDLARAKDFYKTPSACSSFLTQAPWPFFSVERSGS